MCWHFACHSWGEEYREDGTWLDTNASKPGDHRPGRRMGSSAQHVHRPPESSPGGGRAPARGRRRLPSSLRAGLPLAQRRFFAAGPRLLAALLAVLFALATVRFTFSATFLATFFTDFFAVFAAAFTDLRGEGAARFWYFGS